MGKKSSGQALVELALVLPVVGLLIFTGFQIVAACVNLVVMQTQVARTIRKVTSVNQNQSYADLTGFHMWGHTSWLRSASDPAGGPIRPWRPFKRVFFMPLPAINTIQSHGSYIRLNLDTVLWPGLGFTHVLSRVPLQVNAETYLEPDPPKEG